MTWLLFGIAMVLYLAIVVVLLMTAGQRCDYCNKRLPRDDELFLGAHVCEECRERLFGL